MKPNPPQPEWLRNMIYGYAGFEKYRVLMEGKNFAIMQTPGGRWFDNSGGHYGQTAYYLVDKGCKTHGGHAMSEWRELQSGGRVGKKKLAEWKALMDKSDALGAYADEETKAMILENTIDALSVYLDTHKTEALYRQTTGGMTALGKSKDYWQGQIDAHKNFEEKLKVLVPGLVK